MEVSKPNPSKETPGFFFICLLFFFATGKATEQPQLANYILLKL